MMEYAHEKFTNVPFTYREKKGADMKHEDCSKNYFQFVVFQVILPFPVLIDDCEKTIRQQKKEFVIDLKQFVSEACKQLHTRWMK